MKTADDLSRVTETYLNVLGMCLVVNTHYVFNEKNRTFVIERELGYNA